MTISSRTPEGWPARCPLCEAEIQLEPSRPHGDAPCPRCGQLLWFVDTSDGFRLFAPDDLLDRIATKLGVNRDEISSLDDLTKFGSDSLDMIELLMELEEEGEGEAK